MEHKGIMCKGVLDGTRDSQLHTLRPRKGPLLVYREDIVSKWAADVTPRLGEKRVKPAGDVIGGCHELYVQIQILSRPLLHSQNPDKPCYKKNFALPEERVKLVSL